MKLISRYTPFSIVFWVLAALQATPSIAQSQYFPTAVRVGTDVLGLGQTFFGDGRERIEVNGDLAIDKYFLALDIGIDNLNLEKETFSYASEGYYFRTGIDVNFMPEDEDHNALFFGVRYARSYFQDNLQWLAENPYYPINAIESSNETLRGSWAELVGGMKVNVWKDLFVGYTVRFKFLRTVKNDGILIPYEMPGYGPFESKNRIGFNYQIHWRIPLRDKMANVSQPSVD